MNGELDFEGALRERVALLEGLDDAVIDQVLASRITYMPGGCDAGGDDEGARRATRHSSPAASPPSPDRWAAALGFDEAPRQPADGGGRAADRPGGGADSGPRRQGDGAARRPAPRLGIAEADALAVGDGANDLGMLGLAGTGVALHAKPVVQAEARHRVNHGDLTALLFLQGWRRDEFVS